MAKRNARGNPFAGGAASGGVAQITSPAPTAAPDPLADLGGGAAPDPLAGLGDAPATPLVTDGLDALAQLADAGAPPVPVAASIELQQQINSIATRLAALEQLPTEVKTLSDYTRDKFGYTEKELAKLLKAIVETVPAKLFEELTKWFEASLSKFAASGASATVAAGVAPGGHATPTQPAQTEAVPSGQTQQAVGVADTGDTALRSSILDTLLPELRTRKTNNPNFVLNYQSKGAAVWAALAAFCQQKGVQATAQQVQAAFTAAGRLGQDDLLLQ